MKRLVFTDNNGHVNIVYAADKESLANEIGELSDEDYAAHVRKVSVPIDVQTVAEIDESLIPSSNDFRDAWVLTGSPPTISIDASKAKEIMLSQNANLFASLKVKLSNAQDLGDDTSMLAKQIEGIQKQRQAIRQINPNSSTAVQDLLALLHQGV